MIEEISIAGFRSLKEVRLPLKKLNIIYGKNGSGKSSVTYACQVVKNIMTNPNRSLDSFFNLGFINLGNYTDVVIGHDQRQDIKIEFKIVAVPSIESFIYSILIRENIPSIFRFVSGKSHVQLQILFPYEVNKRERITIKNETFSFNGISFENESDLPFTDIEILNESMDKVKLIESIPVKRGFFNPLYPVEEGNPENRIAEILKKDERGILVEKVNKAIKKIFGKEFRVYNIPGTQNFRMRTVKGEFITEIVNEGFGLNQAIAILIQLLKPDTTLALIEEPEIHLHPTAQTSLMEVFIDAIQKDKKQILLSTHSENIVSTILAKISEGTLNKDDVQFFLCTSDGGETKIEVQPINEHGQVEGGLMPFMESELENLKKMLKI